MSNSTKSIKFRSSIKTSTSTNLILTNDDLLTEILVRLPIRSFLRFKFVSKHWLSLITSQHIRHHPSCRKITSASGLFIHRYSSKQYDFIPHETQITKPPFKTLPFPNELFPVRILQSCNGLLLCPSSTIEYNYFIYNPTTNQFNTLPHSTRPDDLLKSVYLAFDPSKSPHYKVVSVYTSVTSPGHYEIEIYSSETRLWKPSGQLFLALADVDLLLTSGIFWNGAIHWLLVKNSSSSLYFDVNEERLGVTPLPLPLVQEYVVEIMPRFGYESRDHLQLIQLMDQPTTKFDVYEMETDFSGWFLKYKVDIGGILDELPEMICSYYDPVVMYYYMYILLSIVREENEEESFLVLQVPGKIIRYNFADMSFKKLCDYEADLIYGADYFHYHMAEAFQFVESLACV